ncbi:PAS domain-containing hybrid sensor histidine kinase/response regulator [Gramella sp. MAR_2010_147]|uniref:PAS domain-containing hybrid sensor histidine kinase/response regulator n=1 Tax=Gramella sp. MAR_2010_147 TaxID=1250205 RepID=UPI00087976E5|nr:PAS domain-containing hybrid sensor histidine kinase/response regulator [Gramella sp. MAR_2010_147]SDR92751.1 PAS domain S-box-containing protein [Gramella sp. MAR_2010_147]
MSNNKNHKTVFFETAEELYHDAPCGYVSFTNDGTIYNMNQTLLEWLGYQREEILGKKKIFEFFKMGSRLFFETHFFPLIRMQGFANEINFEIQKKDKSSFAALINVKEIKGSKVEENRYRASVFDISDRTKYEQELFNAKVRAEKSAKEKAQFLATISHEIRTPLNGILGIGNLLAKTPLNSKQKEYVDILRLSSQNLLGLVNNLLDLSKLEAQSVLLEKKPFAIRTLVNSITHTFEIRCKEKGIQLLTQVDNNIPNYIVGDPIKLNQVLTNLVGNAIKFTCEGFVKVILDLESFHKNQLKLKFNIQDTGTGIPKNKIESIFEEFSQADNQINGEPMGTGLGLSISRKILQLHGSEIKVKSLLGRGSEFFFTVNYERYKGSKQEKKEIDENENKKQKLGQAKILIVEDNPINIFVISEYLNDWKIKYDTANNGQQAIEAIKLNSYDIVLMDIHMPVIDGFEAASTIRNLDLDKQPIILALSATSRENIQSQLDRARIDDFISKPFGPGDLHMVISNYIITPGKRKKNFKNYESNDDGDNFNNNLEFSQKPFNLTRLVKMANRKPEFLKKFISNTSKAFEDYLDDFVQAVELTDSEKISELIHKSTMSTYYIQSDRLIYLLRECQNYFDDKSISQPEIKAKIEETIAEFNKIILGLKEIDPKVLIFNEPNKS